MQKVLNLEEFVFHKSENCPAWFCKKYYYGGANFRYHSFQMVLNILFQDHVNPLIVETGCQRHKEDLGAGMSTSIFGEYVNHYGGRLITVDIDAHALEVCRNVTKLFSAQIQYVLSDSVVFLEKMTETPDLLYLDSYDYDLKNVENQRLSQEHCLSEFKAIESRLGVNSIVLLDDSGLPGGGKPKLVKFYMAEHGWICLYDWQQSVWIRRR